MKRHIFYQHLILLSLSFTCLMVFGQGNEVIVLEEWEDMSKREEVQRYFGYDEILTNYITLPYDASINVNEKGRFVDIGIYLFMLIPLFFVHQLLKKKSIWFYPSVISLLFYWSFCISHSIIFDSVYAIQSLDSTSWSEFYNSNTLDWSQYMLSRIFVIADVIATPLNVLLNKLSAWTPGLTYPILYLIFITGAWIILRRKMVKRIDLIYLVAWVYGFFWLMLSGGIIWYAFLIIPLSFIIIGNLYTRYRSDKRLTSKWLNTITIGTIAFWCIWLIFLRMSNINISRQLPEEHLGKTIVESNLFYFATGLLNEEQTLDNSFKNLSQAIRKINTDDHLIFMVGTSFRYDISNNTYRIFGDNTLSSFYTLYRQYPDKIEFIESLKVSGFKYLIIDLNTNTLDQTPEQSLTSKFKLLLNTVYQNPSIGLIATDRIVEFVDVNGNKQQIGNVFGKIIHRGSYAVYEIL